MIKRSGRKYARDKNGRFVPVGTKGKSGKAKTTASNRIVKSPRRILSKDEAIMAEVMGNKKLRSDRKRIAEAIRRGVSPSADFVMLAARARQKQGKGT